MRENEKAHHMSVLKQQAYDTAMERIRDKVCDLITVIRRNFFFTFFYSISLSLSFSPPYFKTYPLLLSSFHILSPVRSYLLKYSTPIYTSI
jgi:hypothetical protein